MGACVFFDRGSEMRNGPRRIVSCDNTRFPIALESHDILVFYSALFAAAFPLFLSSVDP